MGKRLYDPHMGDLALPTGFVDIDEGPVQAALRELSEETGLIGRIQGIVGTYHIRSDPRGPIITSLHHMHIAGLKIQVADNTVKAQRSIQKRIDRCV